jgi:hypothetical protein
MGFGCLRLPSITGATLIIEANRVLNHLPSNPTLDIDSPKTWGAVTRKANTPRQMQFGLRLHF